MASRVSAASSTGVAMMRPSDFKAIYIHRDPVDMRKAINGLSAIVQSAGVANIFEANLFVFMGKRRDVIKILYFDRCGFCLWQKRLERERFPWPKGDSRDVISITPEQLEWLLSGYDVWKMRPFSDLRFEIVC